MNYPNITYLDGTLKKIEVLEVTVYLAYLDLDAVTPFKTSDRAGYLSFYLSISFKQ